MVTVGYDPSPPESWLSASPSPSLQILPLSQIFVNKIITNCCELIGCTLPACVGLWDSYFLIRVKVQHQLRARFVYFMTRLWQPAMTPLSLRTLWDSGCIQVVMGYIKRKWIHMWGLALVWACLLCSVGEQREPSALHRGPLVVTLINYTQLCLIRVSGIWTWG